MADAATAAAADDDDDRQTDSGRVNGEIVQTKHTDN